MLIDVFLASAFLLEGIGLRGVAPQTEMERKHIHLGRENVAVAAANAGLKKTAE